MIFDGIDVRLVTLEVLHIVSCTHVPNKSHFVTSLEDLSKRFTFGIQWYTLILLTPETKVLGFGPGAKSIAITSAVWPWKLCNSWPDSTSHRAHVASPEPVRTWKKLHFIILKGLLSFLYICVNLVWSLGVNQRPHLIIRSREKTARHVTCMRSNCPFFSCHIFFQGEWVNCHLNSVNIDQVVGGNPDLAKCSILTLLSRPPQATTWVDGPNAHAMTHVVGIVTACSLFVVKASHTISFPSWDEETRWRLSRPQSMQRTLALWPFKLLRTLMFSPWIGSMGSAT